MIASKHALTALARRTGLLPLTVPLLHKPRVVSGASVARLTAAQLSVWPDSVRGVRYGFVVPHADAREIAVAAVLGERNGWDGIFVSEPMWGVDAWVSLAAAAMLTERIRLGTLLTPVSRWKPWDLATRVGTVDRLSNGRAIMSAGLGALHPGWLAFEADDGRKTRAGRADECLAIFDGLMRGQPFGYDGRHYSAKPTDFHPPDPPVQRPRPPVWMVGAHVVGRDRQPSLDRAARWDGLLPQVIDRGERGKPTTVEQLAAIVDLVRARRADAGQAGPYDVVIEADSAGEFVCLDPNHPGVWADAGATWWIESWWAIQPGPDGFAEVQRRIAAGPPR